MRLRLCLVLILVAGAHGQQHADLERRVLAADRLSFQIGIHAIGTKGNHWVLNAYEKARQFNGQRDSRHRIEHPQHLADLVIFDRNLVAIPPEQIMQAKVDITIVGGRVVHQRRQ